MSQIPPQKKAPQGLPYQNKGDLTTGPVKKHLTRLTLPMIWGLLAVISVQLADTYFISLLGTTELAAISYTFPVTMGITHLLFGFNIAMSSVVSRLIGEKRREDVRRIVQHGIFMAFGTAALIALLCYWKLDPLFRLMGADGDGTLDIIREYMPVWLLASAVLAIPVNSNSAIRAGGDTFIPAFVMTVIALINMALDPLLIFGIAGLPELGVKGAAYATLIAYGLGLFLALYFLIFKKDMLCLDSLNPGKFGNSARRLLVIAVPAGITNIIQPVTSAFIVALLSFYGAEAVAAYGVATRVEAFSLLVVIALAVSMAPIIGQNWGAKLYRRVHKTINTAIGFNFIWSFLTAIILGLLAKQIAGLFSDDPAVVYFAALFFWIVPFSYAFGNLVLGWGSAFNAMGMPQRAFFMIVVKALVLTVPAVYIGSKLYGVKGIFIAIAAVNVIAGIGFHIASWKICLEFENREEPAKTDA